jgi:hypothetical protein
MMAAKTEKTEKTEIEKTLTNEPNQAEVDRRCAELLRATAKPTKEEKSCGNGS